MPVRSINQLKGNLTSVTWKGTLQELVGQSGFGGLIACQVGV